MKKLTTYVIIILVILPFSTGRVLTIINIYDNKLYSLPNSLEIKATYITFTNYAPQTLETPMTQNCAWIEWTFVGAKIKELYPTFYNLSEISNSTYNFYFSDNFTLTSMHRGEHFQYSVDVASIFDRNIWSWDYWDISPLAFDSIQTSEIAMLENNYYQNYYNSINYYQDYYNNISSSSNRVLDMVKIINDTNLLSSVYSSFIDHDLFSINYDINSPDAYIQPIFRNNPYYTNTYATIYVNGVAYPNSSHIPLQNSEYININPPAIIQGDPINVANVKPSGVSQHTSIPQQISYFTTISIGVAYYTLRHNSKAKYIVKQDPKQ